MTERRSARIAGDHESESGKRELVRPSTICSLGSGSVSTVSARALHIFKKARSSSIVLALSLRLSLTVQFDITLAPGCVPLRRLQRRRNERDVAHLPAPWKAL